MELPRNCTALDAQGLLEAFEPVTAIEHMRRDLALELLDDVRRLDDQIKASHRRIRTAIKASKTSLTDLYGVGPILACTLIGYTGDVHRFANRDHFASSRGSGANRTFVGWANHPPALASRQSQTQQRHSHGRHLPDP